MPKRDEFSFLNVFAFPKASRIGLLSSTLRSMLGREPDDEAEEETGMVDPPGETGEGSCNRAPEAVFGRPRVARYCMMNLVVSVFPAPDSPLTNMD